VGVPYVLNIMWASLGLFKTLTNCNLLEFEELCVLVVPTIHALIKANSESHILFGWLIKLTLDQHLFQSILYMKHDNVVMYNAFMWD